MFFGILKKEKSRKNKLKIFMGKKKVVASEKIKFNHWSQKKGKKKKKKKKKNLVVMTLASVQDSTWEA